MGTRHVRYCPQFDENYETIEYETKITRLIRSAYRLDEKGSAEHSRMWRDARQALRWEDHYIKVMLRPAIKYAHRGRDLLIYVCVGIAVVFTLLLAVALKGRR